jgi:hypothetical protein
MDGVSLLQPAKFPHSRDCAHLSRYLAISGRIGKQGGVFSSHQYKGYDNLC